MPTGILLPKFFLVFVVLRYPFETSVDEFCVQNSMPSYAELNTKWHRSRCQSRAWQEKRHILLVKQKFWVLPPQPLHGVKGCFPLTELELEDALRTNRSKALAGADRLSTADTDCSQVSIDGIIATVTDNDARDA